MLCMNPKKKFVDPLQCAIPRSVRRCLSVEDEGEERHQKEAEKRKSPPPCDDGGEILFTSSLYCSVAWSRNTFFGLLLLQSVPFVACFLGLAFSLAEHLSSASRYRALFFLTWKCVVSSAKTSIKKTTEPVLNECLRYLMKPAKDILCQMSIVWVLPMKTSSDINLPVLTKSTMGWRCWWFLHLPPMIARHHWSWCARRDYRWSIIKVALTKYKCMKIV